MKSKRYVEYKVVIEYLNGDEKMVESESVDSSSYKEMLGLYKVSKKQAKDDCISIKFIGVANDNEEKIFFEKQLITEDLEEKTEVEKLSQYECFDLIEKIVDDIEALGDKRSKIWSAIGAYNKKQDVILHEIESSIEPTNFEKIRIFDKLKEVREERRYAKNEKNVLDSYFERLAEDNLILNHLKNVSGDFIKRKKSHLIEVTAKIVPLTEQKAEELRIIKEIGYKNFKERVSLTKQLQKTYDKVYHDDIKMKLICYNKSRCS